MISSEPLPAPEFHPCPHCGVPGHWPVYEREQLAAGRCPWSGLMLMPTECVDGVTLACGVCDCFGYPPQELTR